MKKGKIYHQREVDLEKQSLAEPAAGYISFSPQNRVLGFLGLPSGKAAITNGNQAYLSIIRGGLPRHSLNSLMEKTGMNVYEMANILNTTDRTLRRYEDDIKLNREQSERLVELAQLYVRGEEVFGSTGVFKQWMDAEVPALGNQTPKSYLDTSLGITLLLDELTRIEYGVFA
jgi:putative toxin-antitoxin system antitoxin component (TIGR02293 family)